MKTSENTPEEIFQAQLYILLWYLSGWGGRHYSASTRSDMVESVLETLVSAGLLSDKYHDRAIELLDRSPLNDHPFRELMAECFKQMPRATDPQTGQVNTIRWIIGE